MAAPIRSSLSDRQRLLEGARENQQPTTTIERIEQAIERQNEMLQIMNLRITQLEEERIRNNSGNDANNDSEMKRIALESERLKNKIKDLNQQVSDLKRNDLLIKIALVVVTILLIIIFI